MDSDVREADSASLAGLERKLQSARGILNTPAETYLQSRGIPIGEAALAGAMYAPRCGNIEEAVVFPMRDTNGVLLACMARAIYGPEKRIYGQKRLAVFATAGALEPDLLIITEGPLDALSLASCGWPAIALCGTTVPCWLRAFVLRKNIVIATDSDQAGDDAVHRITEEVGRPCKRLKAKTKDWNEDLALLGREALAAELDRRLGTYRPHLECPLCGTSDWRYSYQDGELFCACCYAEDVAALSEDEHRPANVLELRMAVELADQRQRLKHISL
ncbi:MAG: toprim domain-containing protein [Armatimonadota bacterium]